MKAVPTDELRRATEQSNSSPGQTKKTASPITSTDHLHRPMNYDLAADIWDNSDSMEFAW
jgi:hypothetical protein